MSPTIWIDIDNAPQARYLGHLVPVFEAQGAEVILSCRADPMTRGILEQEGLDAEVVDVAAAAGRARRAIAVLRRARRLRRRHARDATLLVCSSRSSALAARSRGIAPYVLCDYEHVELRSYRLCGARLLFPATIGPEPFLARGFRPAALLPFDGLKEDLSLAGRSLAPRTRARDEPARVLLRPPATSSHYASSRSEELFRAALHALSASGARLVLVPRDPEHAEAAAGLRWAEPPEILSRPRPLLELLGSIDWVVSGGGTMLREAAYLGLPAVGIFGGDLGRVDARLAEMGSLTLVRDPAALAELDWNRPPKTTPAPQSPRAAAEVVERVLGDHRRRGGRA